MEIMQPSLPRRWRKLSFCCKRRSGAADLPCDIDDDEVRRVRAEIDTLRRSRAGPRGGRERLKPSAEEGPQMSPGRGSYVTLAAR